MAVNVVAPVFVMNDECVGGGMTQEPLPTLCEGCDQLREIDGEQARPDARRQDPEQESTMPGQKAAGWFSRLRG
ncbi:hypothetical protein AN221_07150 [Streptomyces nanshensis]|uniref:Uncharacterized protein n=1 Tax=Streptomyces nanshensis TaxID=518642 RepID=A0A1E7LYQ7_9ACTN|nr:hypothetical protein AN221_07150 [Streptomyces nanshensis]